VDESSICLTLGFIFEFDVTLLPGGKILCNQVDYVEPPSADSIINAEFLGEQRAVVVAAGFDLVASSTKTLNRCLQTVSPLVINVTSWSPDDCGVGTLPGSGYSASRVSS